jgi:lipoprotein NlpD
VRAAAAGRVAAITEDTNKVPVVVIQHENGLLSVYAQLDNLTVTRGATVTQGQSIGRVRAGDPSFLHFEIRDGMNSVDPMRYLQ